MFWSRNPCPGTTNDSTLLPFLDSRTTPTVTLIFDSLIHCYHTLSPKKLFGLYADASRSPRPKALMARYEDRDRDGGAYGGGGGHDRYDKDRGGLGGAGGGDRDGPYNRGRPLHRRNY